MSCNSLTAIDKTCDGNQGSVTAIYVADFSSVTASTLSAGTLVSISSSVDFVEIKFNKNQATFTEVLAVDAPTGGQSYTQTITVTIPRREVAKRNSIALLAEGNRDLALITKDGNGLYNFFGYTAGVNLTGMEASAGENKKVGSSYKLTFVGEEEEQAPFVWSAIIAGLIA